MGRNPLRNDEYYVSSVGDLLFIVEQFKKNKLQVSGDELISRFQRTKEISDKGLVSFIELDKEVLFRNMFEEDSEGIITLDKKASNAKISPRFSVSLICLKINEFNCFWNADVYNEMEMVYLESESYE